MNCGHINKQYTNTDGQLEDLPCTLEAGHGGDHSARVQALKKNPFAPRKDPKQTYKERDGEGYLVVEEDVFWSDGASVKIKYG